MKTFHQIISNLHAIAEPFIVPTTWLKYFFAPFEFSQVIVFNKLMKDGGGGQI